MSLEHELLDDLRERPRSGGALIERRIAAGRELPEGGALIVYAALARLRRSGAVEINAEGPGERLYALPGTPPAPPSPPGLPPSFALGANDLAEVERALWRLTRGLPRHYFEELRRLVVADADRRVFFGERLPGAARRALARLGPVRPARRYLRRIERGANVELRPPRARGRLVLAIGIALALLVLVRLYAIGVYTLPPAQISMAPTLIPADEGGDRLVLANLLAYRLGGVPRRGDVAIFRLGEDGETFVKRVMGLPGERVRVHKADLFIDGRRLVKERALLDRVKVPLLRLEDLVRDGERFGWRQPRHALHAGFRLPGGTQRVKGELPIRDVVVTVGVGLATNARGSLAILLDEGNRVPLQVLLDVGRAGTGSLAVGGIERVRGSALELKPGRTHEIWLTNADRVFRVEIDSREVARVPLEIPARYAEASIHPDGEGIDVFEAGIARDLVYTGSFETEVPDDGVFVLGDFSSNSLDSRTLGAIPIRRLLGRVFAVVWPPSRMRMID